jgi:polysaccharide deacetylase family protein (PEP-CTERM system associated)
MKNILTFDVEDYYQVSAFSGQIRPEQWSGFDDRVQSSTRKILDLLDISGSKATFFVLGWVAKNHAPLVREIADRGHEVGCHSLQHLRVYEMTPEVFREDTRCAQKLLEDACGRKIRGYRAPSFSITRQCFWAFEILAELGFTYDSSIFPVKHPNYGIPDEQRSPFVVDTPKGPITELPMPTLEIGRRRAPFGGGAYFRILPYWYTRWSIHHINEREGRAVCVYLHPWELDPEQPRMKVEMSARLRHYTGLRRAEGKLRKLLRDFRFCSVGQWLREAGEELGPGHNQTVGCPADSTPGNEAAHNAGQLS